jgi:hypothetical protein
MDADGTNARVVREFSDLQGNPIWAPDGQSITTAAADHGPPQLMRVPLDRRPPALLVREQSLDPVWAPGGGFVVYSGADIGTTFSVKAANGDGSAHPMPPLTLTRGARHLAFLHDAGTLVALKGDIQHKDLWAIDLATGAERQLTRLPSDFDIHDFDLSADGHDVVLERRQDRSDVALLDLARR